MPKKKTAKKAAKKTASKRGRPSKYKPEFCERVVEIASQGKGKAEIAFELGVDRDTLREWAKAKPEFSVAIKKAYEAALVWWEKKGREGTVGEIEGFNSTSYIFQMKNRFKDDWRDKVNHDVEVEVNVGGLLSKLRGRKK